MSRRIALLLMLAAVGPLGGQGPDSVRGTRNPGIASRALLDPREDIAFRALALPDTVWVGQQATYQVGVFLSDEVRTRLRRNPVFVPPELRSMLAYDLASTNSVPRFAGSRRYEVHVFQRALFPLTAGRHEIPPARLEYALPLSNSFFAREESHSARTEPLVVVAREPPQAGRPDDYRGAVGRLSLQSRVDTRGLRTGDPFTYTMVVLGTGNVSLLPRPELRVPWADVVPGAVRVQMDSSTTLVRGRKEFDWVVTPIQPGRQSIPVTRYPFFNPYTEQYEIAFSRPESVSVTGAAVVLDRAAADSVPALPVRRLYEGEVPLPITDSPVFWLALALAPLPYVLLLFGRRPQVVRADVTPERRLRDALRAGSADASLVRRSFTGAVAKRIHLAPGEMADRERFTRMLRRAGVSEATSEDARLLLDTLDDAVFGQQVAVDRTLGERAVAIMRAIDVEARSRAAIAARRMERGLAVLLLTVSVAASAWAITQDLVATKVFSDGLAAYDAREFGVARQAFYELAQARPRAANAWFNFGTASWQLQDTAAAVIGWQRAMRLQPTAGDVRARLRLAPGTPRAWHGVPPVSLTMLGSLGGALWFTACIFLAVGQRRRRTRLTRGGVGFAAVAGMVLIAGLLQQEVLDGRNSSVVLSPTHLRAMPVLAADAGVEAQAGEVVRVLGHQGAWTRVELSDRRRGWVETQRLQAMER